ncbi:MAG: tetratricopeptide repeat protein, partial [Hyphomicrobiaceae bacterium]
FLQRLGMEKAPPIVTSAVLLDARRHLGKGRALTAGETISARDIEAMVATQGLGWRGILPGDVLYVYTGWGDSWRDPDTEKVYYTKAPGLSYDAARYLAEKRVVAVGLDTPFVDPVNEGQLQGKAGPPAGTPPATPFAVHHHLLSGLGKPPMWPIDPERLQEVWMAMKMSKSKPDTAGAPPAPATPRPAGPASAPAGIEKPEMTEADRDVADATRTLDTNPADVAALEQRARAYTRQGKHALAVADYTKAVEAKPDDAALHFARALSLQHLRQFEEAVKAYDEALRIAPRHIAAYNGRGNANRMLKRHEAALRDFEEVLRLNPKYVAALYNRGLVYRDMNRAEDAIRDWTSAIAMDKEYAGAYVQRALLHEKGGARDKAIADFRAALAAPPKYESGQWAHRIARERLAALGAAQP